MINNNMSLQQYDCAQQIDACAQSLKSVCARRRIQLRGNTGSSLLHKTAFPNLAFLCAEGFSTLAPNTSNSFPRRDQTIVTS